MHQPHSVAKISIASLNDADNFLMLTVFLQRVSTLALKVCLLIAQLSGRYC